MLQLYVHLGDDGGAAGAQALGVGLEGMHPAAGTLGALGLGDAHGESGVIDAGGHLRALLGSGPGAVGDDEYLCQVHARAGLLQRLVLGVQGDVGLQGLADALIGTGLFQHAVYILTELDNGIPAGHGLVAEGVGRAVLGHLVQQDVAAVVVLAVGHGLPDLVAGEGQDGGKQPGHGGDDEVQRRLGGAAAQAVLLLAVQTILDDIQVEGAEVYHAEIIDGMGDHVEFIVVIGFAAGGDQAVQLGQRPAIQLLHFLGGNQIVRVEFIQVAQAVAGGVAELQVILSDLLEDLLGAAHVRVVVGGGGPQADDVRAVVLDQVRRVNTVAQGFVHGPALAVHRPAVGQHLLEGSAAVQRAHGGQKAGLEPAAILIRALQIHVRRPQVGMVVHQGCVMGGAGVEPAVQGVLFLGELLAAAVGAGKAIGHQLHGLLLEPDVGAVFIKELGELLDGFRGGHRLAAALAVEHGNGQTPAALAGDAPVGPLADHADHPLAAPGGIPLHVLNGLDGLVLEGFHGAEPLGGGPEDDGLLAAVMVGIGVDDLLGGEEHAQLLQVLQDDGVGLLGGQALVLARIGSVAAVVVHGDDQVHAVAHAGHIVVRAEAGGGVDAACAGIHGDVLRVYQLGGMALQERMLGHHMLKELAGIGSQHLIVLDAADLHHLVHQSLGHDVGLAVVRLHQGIGLPGMQADGHVAGEGPDGGGPDHEVGAAQVELAELAQVVLHRELDVHRGAGVILIFDIRLGHRRDAERAPGHGLQALVDVALVEHPAKHLDLLGLEVLVHGAVGMLPVAHHAQALEALALLVDEILGELLAGVAEFGHGHVLVQLLLGGLDGPLNGQAVVVPAGNIGGIAAHHGMGADDKVLQGLIQGVTHVDVAVAEGRAVVEHKGGEILVLFQHGLIEVLLLPAAEHTRLPGGQTRLHGEIGFRCDDRVLIIHRNTYLQK